MHKKIFGKATIYVSFGDFSCISLIKKKIQFKIQSKFGSLKLFNEDDDFFQTLKKSEIEEWGTYEQSEIKKLTLCYEQIDFGITFIKVL
jgi:hypothetical protein